MTIMGRSIALSLIVICSPMLLRAGGVVNSPDEESLRAALNGGGAVTFGVDGTITLSSPLVISNNTIVDGSGHTVTISGNKAVRVFQVNSGIHFTLQNLTVANGATNAGGGLYNAGGIVTISNCVFATNSVSGTPGLTTSFPTGGGPGNGGAIYNTSTLILLNSSFLGNAAFGGVGGSAGGPEGQGAGGGPGYGGAIYNSGSMGLTNLTLIANAAIGGAGGNGRGAYGNGVGGPGFGGAIASQSGSMTMSNCLFSSNGSSSGPPGLSGEPGRLAPYLNLAQGGALYNQTGNVACASSSFANNNVHGSPASGGALFFIGTGLVTLSNCVIANNGVSADRTDIGVAATGSTGSGGGLYFGGAASLFDCLIASNGVSGGAGSVSSTIFPYTNAAPGGDAKGGGIYSSNTLILLRSAIIYNSAVPGPGGSSAAASGTAYGGGIIKENSGAAWAVNCTVSGNKAGVGGGICNGIGLTNCTIYGNRAGTGGNLAYPGGAINTIVAAGVPYNVYGPMSDYGYNISSDASTTFGSPGSMNSTNPRLGPLGYFGGPTPTMPLLAGSPALDAALASVAPPTDQRGRARPYGIAPDVGAYESSPPYAVVGSFFGLSGSDTASVSIDSGAPTNISSGQSFRFDNLSVGTHSITASNPQLVIAPNPLSLMLGPDVFNAVLTAYPWNTVSLASPSNGMAHVIYAGTNGQVHRLLASSNLVTWFPIATNTVLPANYYEVFDPGSVGQPARFYRSVSP